MRGPTDGLCRQYCRAAQRSIRVVASCLGTGRMRRSLQRGAGAASPTDGQALESVRFEMRDSEGLTIKVSVQRSWLNRRFARELSAVFTRAYNKRRGAGEGPLEASRVHLESPLGWLVSPDAVLQSIAPAGAADLCVLLVRICLLLVPTDPTTGTTFPATQQILAAAGAPELAAHFFIVEQQQSRDCHDWSRECALRVLSGAVLAIPGQLYRNAAGSAREGSDSSSPSHGLRLTRGWTAALAAARTEHARGRRRTGVVIDRRAGASCSDAVSIAQVGMSVTDAAAAGVVQPFALVRSNLLCLCDTLAQLLRIGAVVYCDRLGPPADDTSNQSESDDEGDGDSEGNPGD